MLHWCYGHIYESKHAYNDGLARGKSMNQGESIQALLWETLQLSPEQEYHFEDFKKKSPDMWKFLYVAWLDSQPTNKKIVIFLSLLNHNRFDPLGLKMFQ